MYLLVNIFGERSFYNKKKKQVFKKMTQIIDQIQRNDGWRLIWGGKVCHQWAIWLQVTLRVSNLYLPVQFFFFFYLCILWFHQRKSLYLQNTSIYWNMPPVKFALCTFCWKKIKMKHVLVYIMIKKKEKIK